MAVRAPAKLNLGLEVIGRRPDGYHDLVTIMQSVSLADRLVLAETPGSDVTLSVTGPAPAGEENLAVAAVRALRDRAGVNHGAAVHLEKAIPVAAGLGGASSDAAAALVAASCLWSLALPGADLADTAAGLGSDVPFFLHAGTALVTGRGERIRPLPPLGEVWFVIVTPRLAAPLPRKTATLYGALTPADRSTGERVREQARRIAAGLPLDPALLENAFARPLYGLRPELRRVPLEMREAGAPFVALSGAGPSHYTAFADAAAADAYARELRPRVAGGAVAVCAPVVGPPEPEDC